MTRISSGRLAAIVSGGNSPMIRAAVLVLACAWAQVTAAGCADGRREGRHGGLDLAAPPVPYLGQPAPALLPERFAPGIVSTGAIELNAVFAPDGREFLFTRLIDGGEEEGYPGRTRPVMHHSVFEDGRWSAPRPLLLYPGGALAVAVDMAISPDGGELVFAGRHPHEFSSGEPVFDLWKSRRTDRGWSIATVLPPPVRSPASEIYSVLVSDGSIYFTSNRPGGFAEGGRFDVYRAQRVPDGGFAEPVNVGPPINSASGIGDTFVAPDESYLIFASSRPGGYGQGDLYVSFRRADGAWTDPVNLGDGINTKDTEFCPMVSPDGRYLFFSRRWGSGWATATGGDVFWVDAVILDRFRPR
jgi:hypothetical protein